MRLVMVARATSATREGLVEAAEALARDLRTEAAPGARVALGDSAGTEVSYDVEAVGDAGAEAMLQAMMLGSPAERALAGLAAIAMRHLTQPERRALGWLLGACLRLAPPALAMARRFL
jgi:hypothetical protein